MLKTICCEWILYQEFSGMKEDWVDFKPERFIEPLYNTFLKSISYYAPTFITAETTYTGCVPNNLYNEAYYPNVEEVHKWTTRFFPYYTTEEDYRLLVNLLHSFHEYVCSPFVAILSSNHKLHLSNSELFISPVATL